MPFVVAQKETRAPRSVVVLTFLCLLNHSFFSLLLEEINLAPFAEAGQLPLAIPLCFVSKGQGSPA